MSGVGGSLTNDGTNRLSCFACDYSICVQCVNDKMDGEEEESVETIAASVPFTEIKCPS